MNLLAKEASQYQRARMVLQKATVSPGHRMWKP